MPNASEKNNKIVPFENMKNGSHHKKSKFLFLSERHLLSRKERYLYFLPCIRIRPKQFFLLTTWRMALPTKRATVVFLSELNLLSKKKNVICTFCLAKCIRKEQHNSSYWLHEEWLSPQKRASFCSFLNVTLIIHSRKEHIICTFCLAKCIRKGQKYCSF